MEPSRRDVLAWGAAFGLSLVDFPNALAAPGASSAPTTADADFEIRDLVVDGDRRVGQRFTLLVPRHARPAEPLRLLVLLHGLGETGDPTAGVYAWLDRYGLRDGYRRLLRAPIAPVSKLPYWPKGRVAELNALLRARRFGGMAVACPYTPDVYRASHRQTILDDYADWISDVVLPRSRAELGLGADPTWTSLDGCSLGGYVGIEVFLRKPELFGAWGSVQGALGAHRVASYAERLAATIGRLGRRFVHLETSKGDAFYDVNLAMSKALTERGVAHDLTVGLGPHNQPWLREAGTLEMLVWHDRQGRRLAP